MTGVLTDNMELEANIEQQRLEDLLGQEAVKMGQTILLIQVGVRVRVRVCSVNMFQCSTLRSRQRRAPARRR